MLKCFKICVFALVALFPLLSNADIGYQISEYEKIKSNKLEYNAFKRYIYGYGNAIFNNKEKFSLCFAYGFFPSESDYLSFLEEELARYKDNKFMLNFIPVERFLEMAMTRKFPCESSQSNSKVAKKAAPIAAQNGQAAQSNQPQKLTSEMQKPVSH